MASSEIIASAPRLIFKKSADAKYQTSSEPAEADTVALGCGCLLMGVVGLCGVGFGGIAASVIYRMSDVQPDEWGSFIAIVLVLLLLSAVCLFFPVSVIVRATYGEYPRVFEIDLQSRLLTLKRAGRRDRPFPLEDVRSVVLLVDRAPAWELCLNFFNSRRVRQCRNSHGNINARRKRD